MRFTIQLNDIGHQLVKAPMAAAISPFMISLTHPTHEYMWTGQTTAPGTTSLSVLFSNSDVGSLTSPAN